MCKNYFEIILQSYHSSKICEQQQQQPNTVKFPCFPTFVIPWRNLFSPNVVQNMPHIRSKVESYKKTTTTLFCHFGLDGMLNYKHIYWIFGRVDIESKWIMFTIGVNREIYFSLVDI